MPNRSKQKGNRYERELVKKFEENGFYAERAYASDGRSLGKTSETDLLIKNMDGEWKIQAKRRKSIATYIQPSEDVDFVILREDRGDDFVVMSFNTLLKLLQ